MFTFTDNHEVEWTQEQLAQAHRTGECPRCRADGLHHGFRFDTREEDLECEDCGWEIQYTTIGLGENE